MTTSTKAVPTISLTPVVEGIMIAAATEAVRERNFLCFRATWRMKILKWGDNISGSDVTEALARLIDVDSYLREYNEASRSEGSNRSSFYAAGGDGREVTSPDVYMEVLEMSDKLLACIDRENELADIGFVSEKSSAEFLEENMAWYKQRLLTNRTEQEAQHVLQQEKVKDSKAAILAKLSNLR